MKLFYFIFSLFIMPAISIGQVDRQIDSIFLPFSGQPGCAIGIFQNDTIIYGKGFGLANLDYDIPITTETLFDIGSLSKQFTAGSILLLEMQGKLSLEDLVQKYIPEVPLFQDHPIRIKHLLHHTSGLRDYLLLHMLTGQSFNLEFTEQDGLDILIRQKQLNFEPGSRFEYSNSGYMVLAVIIRRVSGMSIGEYARNQLFLPLKMDHTLVLEDGGAVLKQRAIGYHPTPNGFKREHYFDFTIGGDGQVYTNIKDFFKWHQNFNSHHLGGEEFLTKLLEKGTLNNGDSIDYACGLFHGMYKGHPTISHTGAWGGSRAFYVHFPADGLGFLILSNSAAIDGNLIYQLADLYIHSKNAQTMEEKPINPIYLSGDILETYTGEYMLQPGVSVTINLSQDSLFVFQSWDQKRYAILPVGPHAFLAAGTQDITFRFDEWENGKPNTLISSFQGNELIFIRPGEIKATDVDLSPFPGDYYSDELDIHYYISLENDQLQVALKNKPAVGLTQKEPDKFEGFGMQLRFLYDEKGVFGFLLKAGSVKGIKFKKQD